MTKELRHIMRRPRRLDHGYQCYHLLITIPYPDS